MTLRVAIQRDPIEGSRPGETTHLLAREAQRRGHALWFHLPGDLRAEDGRVLARARPLHYDADAPPGFVAGPPEDVDVATFDVVLVRQDPPVDMAWLTTTWLLDLLPDTIVVNPPRALRDTPEKLFPLLFPDLVPPTVVTRDPSRIRAFRALHRDLVLKPLFDKAGAGIFFLDRDDPNFDVVVESWVPAQGAPVVVQRYEPAARDGSVRVIVVDGEALPALRSVPSEGQRRGNMDRSTRVEAYTLDAAQARCVATVATALRERGIVLAAVDLVGDRLLEVNVTSPGGGVYFDRVYPEPLAPRVWRAIEARVRKPASAG